MRRTEAPYERGLSALVIAVFAAFWLFVFALGDPPEHRSQYAFSALLIAAVATPWVIAARLLWRAWWSRTVSGRPTMDGPALMLAVAAAMVPEERRDWGAAMASELAEVRGPSSRWSFAVGCARVALFPPRSSRVPLVVVGALGLAAVVIAAQAVGQALPAMQVFAVTFVALVGAMAMLAVARTQRMRPVTPGLRFTTAGAAGVSGVAACIALTAYFLVQHPMAAENLSPTAAVVFAVVLASCLGLALSPPRGLTSSRLACGSGVAAALVLGLGFLFTSRWTIDTEAGPVIWVMFAPAPVFFAASFATAAVARSFHAGVQAAIWTALLGTLLVFAGWLPEAWHRYGVEARLLLDGEMGYPIGENLADAIWILVVIPVLGLPFGVIGAAVGRAKRRSPRARALGNLGQQPDGHALLL